MKYLAVKNFAEHQHYRDRIPPWIKFYNRVLDDYDFIQLGGAARSHLMLIWLLASRHKNRIPFDPKYIAGAIHARERVDLDALIGAGWLAVVEESASADASTDASKSGDVEREERRGETEKPAASPPAVRSIKADDPRFAEFWSVYPPRAGGNSRADANKQWRARVTAGVGPDEMIAGARRYKAYCEAEGWIGTRFVKQAATFLGPGEHWAEAWESDAKPMALRDGWFADVAS